MPIGLSVSVCRESVEHLNQLLADTVTLRDLYKKHHWQVLGPTFYPLHLLFDKHAGEQGGFVDVIAERIQMLGGVSLAMGADIAETSVIPVRRGDARRCLCRLRGCSTPTRSSCWRPVRWPDLRRSAATTGPTI